MDTVFLKLLGMCVSACPLIIAAVILRALLARAPKYIRLILWAMVGLRLICPFSVESALSLSLPSDAVTGSIVSAGTTGYAAPESLQTESLPAESDMMPLPAAYAEQSTPAQQYAAPAFTPAPAAESGAEVVHAERQKEKNGGAATILAYIWLAGCAAMTAYGAWSCLTLKKLTAACVRLRGNLYVCDDIDSPFVLGIIRPRIMLPSAVDDSGLGYIEAHERAHIAGGDHIWKPLGYVLLSLYWFDPLVWLSYALLCRDIEYACDERVIRRMDAADKKQYSRTLLEYSIPRHGLAMSMAVCPLAFGETGVKERIRSVLSYKKPTVWIICAAVALCVIAGVCFMTVPVSKTLDSETEAYLHQVILERGGGSGLTSENSAPFEDHIILRADKKGGVTKVYALVWYGDYEMKDDGELEEISGWHVPAVITLDMSGSGYSSDYREPRDGSYFTKDIKEMFPFSLRDKAINIHRYAEEQDGRCREQARKYFMTADIAGMNIGAEMPRIIYADEHIVVMTGTFGMLVYDMDKREIRDRISGDRLRELGLDYLKAYTKYKADSEGKTVLLGNNEFYSGDTDYIYVYYVNDSRIEKKDGLNEEAASMTAFDALHSPLSSEYDDWKGFDEFIAEMDGDSLIGFEAADIGDSFIFTRAEPDWNMSTLQIVRKYYGMDKRDVFDVFPDVPKLSAAIYTPITEDCSFNAAAVDFTGDGFRTMLKAGAEEPPALDSVRYLPVLKISDVDGLEAFRRIAKDAGVMSLDTGFIDDKSFEDTAFRYNAEFFGGSDLFLIYVSANSTGPYFDLDSVGRDGNKLSVAIAENDMYAAADETVVGWLLAVSVPKDDTRGTESAEAYISRNITEKEQLRTDMYDRKYPAEGDYLTLQQALYCVSSAADMIRGWASARPDSDLSEEIYCWPYAGYKTGECTFFGDGTPCEKWREDPHYSLVFHNDGSRESFLGGTPRPAWLIGVYDPTSEDLYEEIIYVDAQTGDMYNSSNRGGYMPSPYTERSEYARLYGENNISAPTTTTTTSSQNQTASLADSDIVSITEFIPDIRVDLKYATEDNFTGQAIYDFSSPSLRYGTLKKLMCAQDELRQSGLSLKIWDAYRPLSAQEKLWEICPDPKYVSHPSTGRLPHCRGNTVDVTLVSAEDGKELEMPSGFDEFSELADRDYSDVSAAAAQNARLLEDVMQSCGFTGYRGEWWHFSDTEDYPIVR